MVRLRPSKTYGMRTWSLSLSSVATSRFCEAILDFLADHKRASEANIRAEDFEGEAYSIYELFSTVWLQSKEAKVNIQSSSTSSILCPLVNSTPSSYN
jgi:hypothetical protein